jgi:hypothetical protein
MDVVQTIYVFGVIIAVTISGWLVSFQVRRRMKKTLGRNPSHVEMASIKTWMQVEQDEELREASKPIHPE